MRAISRAKGAVTALWALCGVAWGQAIPWAAPVDGVWGEAQNWGPPAEVPDEAGESAELGLEGAYVVTLDVSPTIQDLFVWNPDAVLRVEASRTLTLVGSTLANEGVIVLNPSGSGVNAFLMAPGATTVSGGGEIRLASGADNAQLAGSGSLTNEAGHVIRGVGQIRVALVNIGEVRADASVGVGEWDPELQLVSSSKTNQGVLSAASGGVLVIEDGITIDQSRNGVIRALDGGVVLVGGNPNVGADPRIVGGAFETQGSGVITMTKGATLVGVTNNGMMQIPTAQSVLIEGDLTNNGTILHGSGGFTEIVFTESATLGGAGELLIRSNDNKGQIRTEAGATLTHEAGHTIRGIGDMDAALVNNGTIIADTSVALLDEDFDFEVEDKVNNALMAAAADSLLDITEGITLDQTGGGTLLAMDGGTVTIGGQTSSVPTVVGGVLDTEGSGVVLLNQVQSTLDGVRNEGALHVESSHLAIVRNGITNNGHVRVNSTGAGATATMLLESPALLEGSGELSLFGAGMASRLSTAGGIELTNGAGHTISGVGTILVPLLNLGTIAPGIGVGALTVDGDVTLDPEGRLLIELDASGADRLVVDGMVSAAGLIEVALLDGFVPVPCDTYLAVKANDVVGEIGQVVNPPELPGLRFSVVYGLDSIRLLATCEADLNADCAFDVLDFTAFQSLFAALNAEADWNGDGLWNVLDFLAFQGAFVAGCP